MAKLWTPQDLKKLGEIRDEVLRDRENVIKLYREYYPRHSDEGILREDMIDRALNTFKGRSYEGIRSQLRLLKHGAEAARTYGVWDSEKRMCVTFSTLTAAKEHAKRHARAGTVTTVAALICSFEVEQKIIEKAY